MRIEDKNGNSEYFKFLNKQERQCTYPATLRRVLLTIVVVEKHWIFHTQCVWLCVFLAWVSGMSPHVAPYLLQYDYVISAFMVIFPSPLLDYCSADIKYCFRLLQRERRTFLASLKTLPPGSLSILANWLRTGNIPLFVPIKSPRSSVRRLSWPFTIPTPPTPYRSSCWSATVKSFPTMILTW